MEENRNSCPMDVCEKIYRAICCVSHPPQDPKPASPAPNPSLPASNPAVKTHDIHIIPIPPQQRLETPKKREPAGIIPINFDYQKHGQVPQVAPKMEPVSHNEKPRADMVAKVAPKIGPEPPQDKAPPTQTNKAEGKKTGIHIEDRFTEYINRAKIKIRSVSNVGDGKNASGVDKGRDHFSDYIDRAKIRLRTTSSVGGGRSESK